VVAQKRNTLLQRKEECGEKKKQKSWYLLVSKDKINKLWYTLLYRRLDRFKMPQKIEWY